MDQRQQLFRPRDESGGSTAFRSDKWIDRELAECEFKDMRLGKRFRRLLEQLSEGVGGTIPWACQDWANTKAAYRFFTNERVNEAEILAGHFQSTRNRLPEGDDPILVLHDTTQFTYHRNDMESVGFLHRSAGGKDKEGRTRIHTICGISMHSSLVVTTEGLPLGLAAIKFWTRDKFKGSNALRNKINATRVPIEQKESIRWLENLRQSTALLGQPERCVHIGDRESDIYELFCAADEAGTHFLVRTCVDRLVGDGARTIAADMKHVPVQGVHRIQVRDRKGKLSKAILEIRYCRTVVLPPIGKQKKYPELILTVIHATERGTPHGRDRIEWKLLTDLPVRSRMDAVEKIKWYSEDRDIPQNPQVWLQGRGLKAENRRAPCESVGGLLYPELANLLDDHDQPLGTRGYPGTGVHQIGTTPARCAGEKQQYRYAR
jgi:hypothetical protein